MKKYIQKLLHLSYLIFFLFLIFSCQNQNDYAPENGDVITRKNQDSITIQLDQIKILFPSVEEWQERGAMRLTPDSAIIKDRKGEMLLSQSFNINADITKNLKVESQYETNLSIITPNDTISNLKNYFSGWSLVQQEKGTNKFLKPAYTPATVSGFPDVTKQDILDQIFMKNRSMQSEFDWNKYLKQANSINDFPFYIRVSRITLRLKGVYENGKPFVKYIVFDVDRTVS